MWGGQGTVSRLSTSLTGRPSMSVEFLVASGESGYVANMALSSGGDRIDFDEIHTINAWDRIPIDRDVFTWGREWASGSALVRLIVQSIDGSPTGFRVCWLTQYGALNRLACTVNGRDYAAYVVDDYFGNVQRTISTPGDIPWNVNPPAGTPAPAPNPNPLRYAYGYGVTGLLNVPLPQASDPAGSSVSVRDESGRVSTLTARYASISQPSVYSAASTVFGSSVGGQRNASVSFNTSYSNPYSPMTVSALTLSYAGETIALPGQWQLSSSAIYPLDVMLFEGRNGSSIARLILQSFDGARTGYRLCWLTQHRSLNRLFCGVAELPGTSGFMVDDYFGDVRTFR